MLAQHRRRLTRTRMLKLLDELRDSRGKALCRTVPGGLTPEQIEAVLTAPAITPDTPEDFAALVATSKMGAAILWSEHLKYLIIPPFPGIEGSPPDADGIEAMQALLRSDRTIAIVAVRLGEYGIGLFEGETRVSSKVGTGLVHSRHKKGGSSQGRFKRHREKQMEAFFDRVCGHAREILEPYSRGLDFVVYGGESNTLRAFRERCQFLTAFDDLTLDTRLNIRNPRQATLEEAIQHVWSTEVIEWVETD